MKYMKLGTRPDTFYTEDATRSVLSDVPCDLIIQINNIRYRLHKFPLLMKCGLLQHLCSDSDDSAEASPVMLHDLPGGEEAFELCAKFAYGITINLSAHNFVPAICAAKFLRMTESVSKGNFITKLEAFFDTCLLQGWKDSILSLTTATRLTGWPENLGIVHRCTGAIVERILTHPSKVTWSFTYSRPGFSVKQHRSVPRDWWTEDVSELDLDHFRGIISAIRSAKEIPPPLIGEALHVYACKHLPDPSDPQTPESSRGKAGETPPKHHRHVLEAIVSMIPGEYGSVTGGFLLRLLKTANLVGASASTKAELVRRSGRQLHEAGVKDLLFPSAGDPESYDVDLVGAILENFLAQFRRPTPQEGHPEAQGMLLSMTKVAATIDSYLQVIAQSANVPVSKFAAIAEALPEAARPQHDDLYGAVDAYLKEHPELSKEEKRRLCRMIDCRKLSAAARSHAVRNDRLPLRTIVQVLFVEQERAAGAGALLRERGGQVPGGGGEEAEEAGERRRRGVGEEGEGAMGAARSAVARRIGRSRSESASRNSTRGDGNRR